MGFEEGRLEFNSDTGIYYSGQTAYGKLIFDQEKEKKFRGIYIKLKGFCYVHWRTSHTRRVHGKVETYHVDHLSREEYVNQKSYLIGSEHGETKIPPGHYEYSFQLAIPQHCPSSFEGTHGHIRYEVKAVVDRAFKTDQEKKAVIRIIAPLDLNTEHGAKDPVQIKFDETYYCCCSRSGSVTAVVKVPYGGYIPGQAIPIEVGCENKGSVTIDSITFTLKKDTTFHAQGTRSESADVAQLQVGEVLANTSRTFSGELLVPYVDTPNVRQCRYIDVTYRLKVTLSPDGCHSDSSQSGNIVIGTIPIVGTDYPTGGQDQMAHQNEPVVTQPLANPYPGDGYYPSNNPYPGPVVTPYPTANPQFHNDPRQYPPPYTATPSGDSSYPSGPAPYPNPSFKAPYPEGPTVSPYPTSGPTVLPYRTSNSPYPTSDPTVSPYPTSNSPYPTSGPTVSPYPTSNSPYPTSGPTVSPYPTSGPTVSPYPTSNSPYPTSGPTVSPYPPPGSHSTAPYPTSPSSFPPASANTAHLDTKPAPTGLRTGTFGFLAQAGDNKTTMPQLPQGAVPYPFSPSPNPFAAASAPEPGTPNEEKK